MSPARWEGPGQWGSSRTLDLAYHRGGAPWPTCSCPVCRRARAEEARVDAGFDRFADAAERVRSERRDPGQR